MIVAPHHDDEIIGCGGKIIQEINKNNEVHVVVLTSGGLTKGNFKISERNKREEETLNALKFIGVNKCNVHFLRFKERDNFVNLSNALKLSKLINNYLINEIYFPHELEQDFDHKNAYYLTRQAIFLSRECLYPLKPTIRATFEYEVWTPIQSFQKVVNISDIAKLKHDALKQYTSQNEIFHLSTGILGLNRYRGFQCGCVYAEVFKTEIF